MEVELHQLTLRYAHLRRRHPLQERALLTSLSEIGQQVPIVVVGEVRTGEVAQYIVIDGYKRLRALKRLARDTVRVAHWSMPEAEALILERALRSGREDALEQGWLLVEMQERFGLSLEELAQRFGHSKSWVSERLALIQTLPGSIQDQVRAGTLSAYAAMKYLVPWARTDRQAAQQLCTAVCAFTPTSRQVGALYQGWQDGSERTRALILSSPQVYLQAQALKTAAAPSALQRFLQDLGTLGGIARRAYRALQAGLLQELIDTEHREVTEAFTRVNGELQRLIQRVQLESGHAG